MAAACVGAGVRRRGDGTAGGVAIPLVVVAVVCLLVTSWAWIFGGDGGRSGASLPVSSGEKPGMPGVVPGKQGSVSPGASAPDPGTAQPAATPSTSPSTATGAPTASGTPTGTPAPGTIAGGTAGPGTVGNGGPGTAAGGSGGNPNAPVTGGGSGSTTGGSGTTGGTSTTGGSTTTGGTGAVGGSTGGATPNPTPSPSTTAPTGTQPRDIQIFVDRMPTTGYVDIYNPTSRPLASWRLTINLTGTRFLVWRAEGNDGFTTSVNMGTAVATSNRALLPGEELTLYFELKEAPATASCDFSGVSCRF